MVSGSSSNGPPRERMQAGEVTGKGFRSMVGRPLTDGCGSGRKEALTEKPCWPGAAPLRPQQKLPQKVETKLGFARALVFL